MSCHACKAGRERTDARKPMPCVDLTILILCLDEERSIARCVGEAGGFLRRNAIEGEVLVVDNGSQDRSAALARAAGARVVVESERGYGRAVRAGIEAAWGRYVVLGDGDGEHDLNALEPFWEKLRSGCELVVGNRFTGADRSSMRFLNRHVGAPLLSAIGRFLFRAPVRDFHCGLRGFHLARVRSLALRAPGMESASEMIVKAMRAKLRIAEVAVSQRPAWDADRVPRLRIWRDGWRHLRLLLLLSPKWLFLRPGSAAVVVGLVLLVLPLLRGDWLGTYAMLFGAGLVVCGTQLAGFAAVARLFGERMGFHAGAAVQWVIRHHVLEWTLVASLALAALGIAGSIWSVFLWAATMGDASLESVRLRVAIPSVMALIVAIQTAFSGFLVTLLASREI